MGAVRAASMAAWSAWVDRGMIRSTRSAASSRAILWTSAMSLLAMRMVTTISRPSRRPASAKAWRMPRRTSLAVGESTDWKIPMT
ncbi:MAG: hypothetical protein A2V76_00500 [Candidatus Aminicenantes bacterium RBG_16_63_14]|nr:MAG: hypothetical protein A2V76_00500 [Candidatus Aminicenantes bacterium RBG_16_63_14]